MNTVSVRLKLSANVQRPIAAWLVRSGAAAEWLAVAANCPGEQESLRFLPLADAGTGKPGFGSGKPGFIPDGEENSMRETVKPAAVLIISERLAEVATPAGCQAYGFVAERLLIPIDAEIEPPLTSEEFRDWMPDDDALFVWHPSDGLVRFDPQDVLTIFDLLIGPEEEVVDWDAARTAPAFVERLLSVASAEPVRTMADVEAEWNQEIGPTRSMENLPPAPGEAPLSWKERLAIATEKFRQTWRRWWGSRMATPRGSGRPLPDFGSVFYGIMAICALVLLASLWNSANPLSFLLAIGIGVLLMLALLGALGGFAGTGSAEERPTPERPSSGSSSSSGPGWFQQLWTRYQQWRASRNSAGSWMQQADRSLRQREIQRLLHMLEENPEDGLRYAIPFGGDAGRGHGVAGNELVGRELNFQLAPGSGGPVDTWDIDPQQQMLLLQRYRELAEREQRTGRFRRAAYVYSQLLGDWHSAANVLKTGRFFAEAAVIYHERLKNCAEAAKCYEQAGQHAAALKLYRDQRQWIAAGDLCERLGRTADAERDYRTAVDESLATGDMRTAADVLETKLHVVDQALEVLERTWPEHTNADQHFDHWFAITARHARHDVSRRRIDALTGDTTTVSALKLLPRLQGVQNRYPDAAIQHLAAEKSLQLIGRHLPESASVEAKQLSQFLPPLSPQDRLLPRDCQRFVDRRREVERRPPMPKAPRTPQLRLEIQSKLPMDNLEQPILACSLGWLLLEEPEGYAPQALRLVSWKLLTQQVRCDRRAENYPCDLAAVNESRREIWLSPSGADQSVSWPEQSEAWRVKRPAFLPPHWLAVQPMPSGLTHVLWVDKSGLAWLSLFTADGMVARSSRFAENALVDPAYAVPLTRGVAAIIPTGLDEVFAFIPISDEEILGECFDAEGTRIWSAVLPGRKAIGPVTPRSAQILILRDESVALLEDPRQPQKGHRVLTGWARPEAAVLPGGLFAVADDRRIAVFTAADGRQILEYDYSSPRPLAIAAAGIGRFSIFREEGHVEVWSW